MMWQRVKPHETIGDASSDFCSLCYKKKKKGNSNRELTWAEAIMGEKWVPSFHLRLHSMANSLPFATVSLEGGGRQATRGHLSSFPLAEGCGRLQNDEERKPNP